MTTVLLDAEDILGANVSGSIEVRPWAGDKAFTVYDGEQVILGTPATRRLNRGAAIAIEIEPTDGTYCVRWRIMPDSRQGSVTRYTTIPDVESVGFGDLPDVDPDTFLPVVDVPSAQEVLAEAQAAADAAAQSASDAAASAAAVASATQGSTITGYGPSYMVGVRATEPDLAFFPLVAEAGGFASARNRAVSGATGVENAYDALTGINGFRWEPLTDGGIVLVEPNINCVQLFGPNPKGFAAALNSTRTLVALLRSRARVPSNDPSFDYTGTWVTVTGATNGGTVAKSTTEVGAKVAFTFEGTEATLVVHAKDIAAGGTEYGPIQVSVDGGAPVVHTLSDKAISYVPGSSGARYGSPITLAPYPVRVWGLPHGVHTIELTNVTAAHAIIVREALLPASNPPGIILVADAPRPDWSSSAAGGSNAVLADYNRQLWQVADEFGGPIVVADPTPGWDNATMSDIATNDGKHPSNLGHAHYADAILPRLRALGWSPAWTGWIPGDGYPYTPPPVNPIVDTFNRADGVLAGSTTSDGDAVWAASGGTTIGVVSNRAKATGGSGNSYAWIETSAPDGLIKATIADVSGAPATQIAGILFRYQDDNNHWTLQLRSTSSIGDYALIRRTTGTAATIAASGVIPLDGDAIEIELAGNSIVVRVNGVQIINQSAASFATATKHGLYANNSDTVSAWDSWEFTAG